MEGRVPPFRATYAPPDEEFAARFLGSVPARPDAEARIDARAGALVAAIRARAGGVGGIEDFLHAYSLSTKEGLALMVLAEALLRVPDAATADRLIEDKLRRGIGRRTRCARPRCWCRLRPGRSAFAARDHPSRRDAGRHSPRPGRPARTAGGAHRHPAGDAAHRLAFRARPNHRARRWRARAAHPRIPLLLRHARRGRAHRRRRRALFRRLCQAIAAIGAQRRRRGLPQRPGISVKLSALHPRYEAIRARGCWRS